MAINIVHKVGGVAHTRAVAFINRKEKVNVEAIARYAGVTSPAVRRWLAEGVLPEFTHDGTGGKANYALVKKKATIKKGGPW